MKNYLDISAQAIYDKKGFNILALDVAHFSSLTDYFIIAEGSVERHVTALSKHVQEKLKQIGIFPYHVEGQRDGDWIVLDYGNFIIHLMIPDAREKYALEEIWREAKVVSLKINLEKSLHHV